MLTAEINILSDFVLAQADAICFTSNGVLKKNACLVMGAGNAKAFKNKFNNIDALAGKLVFQYGNFCQEIKKYEYLNNKFTIVAFPTKYHWKDNSNLALIEKSAKELVELANINGWKKVFLPAPGINNGKLSWDIVEKILSKILDDRFTITFYKG